ncbi:hypothetical protein NDU88_006271 [Pleurodeles waltl]|uniref:Uncharacterized protein n=1 Tax=Pleurodeles waltl TaxID=8319 RepID=A0AAV7LWG8_PLEWA|nr:hypothetical protein NDU88_006271 [Pleurodeles waltl]
MTPRKRTLRGHLFSNSQEEDVIEEMIRRWMTNWNDYGVRDIVHTMKQWDSLVQLHAATLMCNIIIQEYEDDGSSAPAGLVDLRKRASTGLPFGVGIQGQDKFVTQNEQLIRGFAISLAPMYIEVTKEHVIMTGASWIEECNQIIHDGADFSQKVADDVYSERFVLVSGNADCHAKENDWVLSAHLTLHIRLCV